MSLFRHINIAEAKGTIYMHSMPGRFETMPKFLEEARLFDIDRVVCLTQEREIKELSPDYFKAIQKAKLPFEWHSFQIKNFGAPEDYQQYAHFVQNIAECVRNGESVLIHCAAGIGRTGMFATSILLALGISSEEAKFRVRAQGASPERAVQHDLIQWIVERSS